MTSQKSNNKIQLRMDIIKEMTMATKKTIIQNIQNKMAIKNKIIIMKKIHFLKIINKKNNKKLLSKM